MRLSLLFSLLTFTLSQSVDLTKPSSSINVNPFFASYAVEWQGVLDLFVTQGNNVVAMTEISDSVLNMKSIQLIKTLIDAAKSSTTQTPFVLRVGGNSANKMWWVPSKFGSWTSDNKLALQVGPGTLIILQKVCKLIGIKLLLNIGMVYHNNIA